MSVTHEKEKILEVKNINIDFGRGRKNLTL